MQSPQIQEYDAMVKFPKINHKSKSTSSGTKSAISLQDAISAKAWMYYTSSSQLGIQ